MRLSNTVSLRHLSPFIPPEFVGEGELEAMGHTMTFSCHRSPRNHGLN